MREKKSTIWVTKGMLRKKGEQKERACYSTQNQQIHLSEGRGEGGGGEPSVSQSIDERKCHIYILEW